MAPRHASRLAPLLALLVTLAGPAAGDERIGFREEFSSAGGWQKCTSWPTFTGMASVTADGRQTTFSTLNGTFASATQAPDWPDWEKNAAAGLGVMVKQYPGPVDLDRYHYLVAHMTFSGTYMALGVNGWDTKVCYTTGLHAVDLHDLPYANLRGK